MICLLILSMTAGFSLALFSLERAEDRRENIGTMVGWDGHQRTIVGTADRLLSASQYSRTYRVTISEIDKKSVEPFDVALILAPNLWMREGDTVTAIGKFSFPRDTTEYMAEKQLWNNWLVWEFRAFHTDKTPPKKYSIFVRMREWFDQKLSEIFPDIGHDILWGIILWQKNNFDPELKQSLKNSGLMHIMVVSGGNVIMLIIFLSLFIRVFHPLIRVAIITLTIIAFVILVWGDIPVWRAALMGIVWYSASLWWYRFTPLLLPLIVATCIAFFNPLSLAYDIGLQLSFLSVICIIVFGKKLTKIFHFLGSFFDEAMAMTVAAMIGTFPITVFYFGTFSLVWPLANLFAAPAIPVLMYGGILTLFVSSFSSLFAHIVWYLPWMAVTYLMKVITFFGSQSWSMVHLELGPYKTNFLFASLVLLMIFIIRFSIKK